MTLARSGWAQASVTSSPPATNYVYCNVYLNDACFGIGPGDTLNMEIPVDFMLDTIRLHHGVQAVIYEGYHPEDVFAGKAPKNCPDASSAYQCRYVKSPGQYDLLYQATAAGHVIHIHITGVTDENQSVVVDFLSGFLQCHATGQSMECTDKRLFKGID